jgi:hypothetical protein
MTDVHVQFHALPQELLPLVTEWVAEFGLSAVAIRFFPFEVKAVALEELQEVFTDDSPYEEVVLTVGKPSLHASHQMDFADKNPSALHIGIKRLRLEGLRQTFLSARTDDPRALAIWKQSAKRLKKITRAGVVAANPDTGATSYNRTSRYTAGAESMASAGVAMLPIGGGVILRFPDSAEGRQIQQRISRETQHWSG